MLELAFSAQDAAQIRLAYSALGEAVAGIRALKDPSHHALHLPWMRRVRSWLQDSGTDIRLLSALVPLADRVPDFVTPPPVTPASELGEELDRLRATPADQVRQDVEAMAGPRSLLLAELHTSPDAGLSRLADEIATFWEGAIAPHWPRMQSLLEGDILHRARRIAEGGADLLFRDLHPQVTWRAGTLLVAHRPYSHTRTARGHGLLLTPSVFTWPKVFTQTAHPWQPTLIYPARGVAALWEHEDTRTPAALAKVLGHSRARLLVELDAPATTTDLARRTGMTSGGTSQHLTALRDAGLITAYRDRRYVLYTRTPIADSLLAVNPPAASPDDHERAPAQPRRS
ncbi:DUF5937 family protein [Nonomuraea sp. NPDC000554]|uniref:ArsR/SmtB family transcription factor n=1 Tax=Nonomuraea sp. NPDC000554 TaxID=3154259 RepID=UPI0033218980